MNYNQFQRACKEAWQTDGQGDENIRMAHKALLSYHKVVGETKKQAIARAWQYYKSNLKR